MAGYGAGVRMIAHRDDNGEAFSDDEDVSEAALKAHHDLQAAPKTSVPLLEDQWGMAIMCIVKDLPDVLAGAGKKTNFIRLLFSFLALILNIILQFALLHWVWEYVVRPAVHQIQSDYQAYHQLAFLPDGTSPPLSFQNWQDPEAKQRLCESALTMPVFLYGILLLWTCRMLQEFRETNRIRREISMIPALGKGLGSEDMVQETEDDDANQIIALTRGTRVSLYGFVVIPKFLVCCGLLWLGCRWLSSTESFGDLILNAMALEFVINIDELLFAALYPESAVAEINQLQWAVVKVPKTEAQADADTVWAYTRSVLFVLGAFVWVIVYQFFLQQVLPGYNQDVRSRCQEFFANNYNLICEPDILSSLGGTITDRCFPYGPPTR